ncbi:Peptidase M30, hyicolysin [Gemmatirosa kalamazoonensis]|uniref:Peptidase M30, hyicolysin n=1 Tax=Gemmatirosa kalamazoonensis TaxID=861299 RepID=W0RCB6_9BACT|nr:Ig-like domain-containing protein [Gemmatirosa kalamazoonensis]AHG88436.1 Peptidase M30, hyicolysin [Gemmatirosa kalamazoonensis]
MRPALSPGSRHAARRLALGGLAAAALVACGGDSTGPGTEPPLTMRLDIVPAEGSLPGFATRTLGLAPGDSARMSARLNDSKGGSQAASGITWSSSATAVADVDATGLVRARTNGTAIVIARTSTLADTLTVTVSACGAAVPVALGVGEARSFATGQGSTLCVTGADRDEFVLVAFNTEQDSLRVTTDVRTSLSVTGNGIAEINAATAAFARAPLDPAAADEPRRDVRFEQALRERAGAELRPRLAAAHLRAPRPAGLALSVASAATTAAVPAVGQLLSLNTSMETCDTTKAGGIRRRTGRVVAVTDKAIVVADTANPPNGFTDAEYRAYGVAFDTLAYPVDVANFGGESDVDKNGRSIIFFTSAVNLLTPRNADYYVGGFFYERDLFQNSAPKSSDFCGGSNFAEMFYMLVPDPTGRVNGNVFRKGFVDSVTVGTLAHEFQHLINASRRIYVNNADNWEDTWLNEGLSHVAEELVFQREAGITTRTRLDSTAINASRVRSAFNFYMQGGNISRLAEYFQSSEGSSPYADNDDLETRGATWAFLRYAADRVNGNDAALWQKLVTNTKLNGMPNLRAALGVDQATLTEWFRDWSIANFVDGVPGVTLDPRYAYRSWNFRSVMASLRSARNILLYSAYPIVTHTLRDGLAERPALRGGAAAYFRFTVGGGKQARILTAGSGAPLPANVALSVVRTR